MVFELFEGRHPIIVLRLARSPELHVVTAALAGFDFEEVGLDVFFGYCEVKQRQQLAILLARPVHAHEADVAQEEELFGPGFAQGFLA